MIAIRRVRRTRFVNHVQLQRRGMTLPAPITVHRKTTGLLALSERESRTRARDFFCQVTRGVQVTRGSMRPEARHALGERQ